MAGHSKFKNIMHRKGRQDAKRAKEFTKVGREIQVAAKMGDADPANNPRLRAAIQAARAVNMPKDRIERAIQAATGGGEGVTYEERRYEGYGAGGIAVIVEVLTDNINRSASEVRAAFSKQGGVLGETGSVAFSFERLGCIKYLASKVERETMEEQAIEAGAQDIELGGEEYEVFTDVEDFALVKEALEEALGDPIEGKLVFRPVNTVAVDENKARSVLKLIDLLEDNDDVQAVYSNLEIDDAMLEKLASEL